ncbi:MAG: hypothetical protein R2880_18000 [Deinococcales bacterium]
MMKILNILSVLLGLMLCSSAFAQDDTAPPAVLSALANVPLSVQLGADDLFVEGLGLHVGASFYPLPIILRQEFTVDIAADLSYRSGEAPFFFYIGAGPRMTVLGSDWLLGQGPIGSYVGGGAVVGLEFDLDVYKVDVINIIGEISVDYMFELGGQLEGGLLKPRFSLGVQIPLANLSVGQDF